MRYFSVFALGFWTLWFMPGIGSAAHAGDGVSFTATVDRQDVSMDQSVSLKFTISSEGNNRVESIYFNAPDFDVINEYNSTFIESYYENGRFGMRNNQHLTKVLRPKKIGSYKITGIEAKSGDKIFKAPDITIQVKAGGAGTPPPRLYGGGGVGLRGSGKKISGHGFFVRAELDKAKAYKGEQVIVSYYLYHRVRISNPQVDKFPMLNGFLKEDLEMPIMGHQLGSDSVVVDGVPYQRSLLMRYAIYPLKEGKLTIDALGLKLLYFTSNFLDDDMDPFRQFFQNMIPGTQVGTVRSETLSLDVEPIPQDGRPASFSGGVGDFNVTAALDKYETKINEPVTLVVKVAGKGNVAAIEEPKANWPSNVELYESKGRSKTGAGGVGEKIFELLLIPRSPGKLTLPRLEMSFFDPSSKTYVTRATESIEINVLDSGTVSSIGANQSTGVIVPPKVSKLSAQPEGPRGFKVSETESYGAQRAPWARWFFWLSISSFVAFLGYVAWDQYARRLWRRSSGRTDKVKQWKNMQRVAETAPNGLAWGEVVSAYEQLSSVVYNILDQNYDVGARSLSRSELQRILVGQGRLPESTWERASRLLEFAETVRFASATGVVTEDAARSQLANWVKEARQLETDISDKKI